MKPGLIRATAQRAALLENLEICSLVKPVLLVGGALLEARDGSLAITSDNLSIRCRVELAAQIEAEGSVVVSAQRLLKLLENSDGDAVTFSAKDAAFLEITCGGISGNFACGSVSDFPQRPTWPVAATFEIPNIRGALEWLAPVLNDDGREKGIHFAGDGRQLRIEAIDGRQMHCLTLESPAVANVAAPASLVKLAKVFEPGGACTVEISERSIALRTGETFIQAQLLEGSFPDVSHIIPGSAKAFVLPKAALESALNAAAAVLEKNTGPRHVNVSVTPSSTTISTARCAAGLVESAITAPNSYEVAFQIDPARLLAAIKHVDGDEVVIQVNDPSRSACVRSGEKIAVIALMRVVP